MKKLIKEITFLHLIIPIQYTMAIIKAIQLFYTDLTNLLLFELRIQTFWIYLISAYILHNFYIMLNRSDKKDNKINIDALKSYPPEETPSEKPITRWTHDSHRHG